MTLIKKFNNLFSKKVVVLMYHRIAGEPFDPWRLCVTEQNFNEQVSFLSKNYSVIPVPELIRRIQKKEFTENAVCITFDDGYTDNFLYAKPALEQYKCPATFFIATDYIGSGELFWWDILDEIILSTGILPAQLSLDVNAFNIRYSISDTQLSASQLADQSRWEWPADPPNDRCRLYLAIWEKLLPLPYENISLVINELAKWAGYNQLPETPKIPMTMEQLSSLSSGSLFTLGIHTASHLALSFHNKQIQQAEIGSCKQFLQSAFPHTVDAIAFPYGRSNNKTLEVLKELRVHAGFSTQGKTINKHSDNLTLGRMQVGNWNANEFKTHIKNWFNHY